MLLLCSLLWGIGILVIMSFADASTDGWCSTPLLWLLVLAMTPVACIIVGIALVVEHRELRFGWFDWLRLALASVAVLFGGMLIFIIVDSMHGMGIV
jgi:hypothetical protein